MHALQNIQRPYGKINCLNPISSEYCAHYQIKNKNMEADMRNFQRVFIRSMKIAQLYVHLLDKLKISVSLLCIRT